MRGTPGFAEALCAEALRRRKAAMSSNMPDGDTHPVPLISNEGPMFNSGDHVRHLKSMRPYVVLLCPPLLVIEATGQPAYAYKAIDASDPRVWIRPMSEMEDGRFSLMQRKPVVPHLYY